MPMEGAFAMECSARRRIGIPARSRSALGAPGPIRRPMPAAGTRIATSPHAFLGAVTSRSSIWKGVPSGVREHLVEKRFRFVLSALFCKCNLADENGARLCKHALFSGGKAALALTTPEIADDLRDLE